MTEKDYEKYLAINTTGVENLENATFHYNRYEATPYFVLEALCNNFEITSKDTIVDFGCGKGRLAFYINHFNKATVYGIEMNSKLIELCNKNNDSYLKSIKKQNCNINFYNILAQDYNIKATDNIFYFFNPFSLQIFIKVLANILVSYYEIPREIKIILYYPSSDYIYYLDNNSIFTLEKDIKLSENFNKDNRERLLIYKI